MSKNAYIYLLEHSSNPNICKVGKTRVSVKSRADSYAGGVFTEFFKWKVELEDLDSYEIKAHKELTKYKVPEIGYREIFSINPKDAKIKLDSLFKKMKLYPLDEIEKEVLRRAEKERTQLFGNAPPDYHCAECNSTTSKQFDTPQVYFIGQPMILLHNIFGSGDPFEYELGWTPSEILKQALHRKYTNHEDKDSLDNYAVLCLDCAYIFFEKEYKKQIEDQKAWKKKVN